MGGEGCGGWGKDVGGGGRMWGVGGWGKDVGVGKDVGGRMWGEGCGEWSKMWEGVKGRISKE